MTDPDPVLCVKLAYCLTWEIASVRASQYWLRIRDFIKTCERRTEMDRWVCELYEESSPTAQEERSIVARINAQIDQPRSLESYRQAVLELLPGSLYPMVEKHRLIKALACHGGSRGRFSLWLAERKITALRSSAGNLPPMAEREADFLRFIESPLFVEAYRKFWHQAPKYRNNQQVRVLTCLAASLSQMVRLATVEELQVWIERLGCLGSFSIQTQRDLAELCMDMTTHTYDAQELAYRLLVDAQEVDRRKLIQFCYQYADSLTEFAQELVRGLQLSSYELSN
jgi:hypothetical protein